MVFQEISDVFFLRHIFHVDFHSEAVIFIELSRVEKAPLALTGKRAVRWMIIASLCIVVINRVHNLTIRMVNGRIIW